MQLFELALKTVRGSVTSHDELKECLAVLCKQGMKHQASSRCLQTCSSDASIPLDDDLFDLVPGAVAKENAEIQQQVPTVVTRSTQTIACLAFARQFNYPVLEIEKALEEFSSITCTPICKAIFASPIFREMRDAAKAYVDSMRHFAEFCKDSEPTFLGFETYAQALTEALNSENEPAKQALKRVWEFTAEHDPFPALHDCDDILSKISGFGSKLVSPERTQIESRRHTFYGVLRQLLVASCNSAVHAFSLSYEAAEFVEVKQQSLTVGFAHPMNRQGR